MPFANKPREKTLDFISNLKFIPFWLDDEKRPVPKHPLQENLHADLVVIGGGFTGLWTALLAKEENPTFDVLLIEGERIAQGASGRNGGFISASITHGFENGLSRWPNEMKALVRLGNENLHAIEQAIAHYSIDCDYIRSGELVVTTEPYQNEGIAAFVEKANSYGENYEWLDSAQTKRLVNSPLYLGGVLNRNVGMVNPAKLAWGLARACAERGVRLFEHTTVIGLEREAGHIAVKTRAGKVSAKKVALATNAFPPLLRHLSLYVVPVYDYALMTEPLTESQRAAVGWESRVGVGDANNQFHYYRITKDGRILWGGYDAVYYKNNGFGAPFEQNTDVFARLAEHFFETFPRLEGLKFTHGWGGAIDTCSRFSAFWGKAFDGNLVYSLGFTGLGVGASRFGALVMLDLLYGRKTERTALKMVKTKPFPFPPEPFRSPIIQFTQWSLAQADRNQGRRNLWLKTLDALGLGFDS